MADEEEPEQEERRLLLKIFANDPEVTSLNLGSITFDLGDPEPTPPWQTVPRPPWWGQEDPADYESGQDDQKIALYEKHAEEAIRSLECNHTIRTVRIDSHLRYEMSHRNLDRLYHLLIRALTRLPSLENLEWYDEHEVRVDELIHAFDKKLKVLTVKCVNFGSVEGVDHVAEKLRGHPTLEEVCFDTRFETNNRAQNPQTLVIDPLVDALASIPNLAKLKLIGSALSSADILRKLVQHPKLRLLSLNNVHLGERLCIAMSEALTKDKKNMELLDLSSNFFIWHSRNGPDFGFNQESAEALFRLVEHQPLLRVKVSSYYSLREKRAFFLDDREGVDWFLQKEEIRRGIRLKKAGLPKALRAEGTPYSEWVDVMAKVSKDTIALFHILREVPTICDPHKHPRSPSSIPEKAKPMRFKKRKHPG